MSYAKYRKATDSLKKYHVFIISEENLASRMPDITPVRFGIDNLDNET
jgi:hypothetical protein